MNLSTFNSKFYLIYYEEKLQLINSLELLKDKYKEYLKKQKDCNTNKKNNENNNNNNNNNIHENNNNNNNNENNINENNVEFNNEENNINDNNANGNGNEVMNSTENNSFLIVSEFTYISPSTFKINGPILSYELRKEIKDISYLCRSWRLCKKNEETLISIGDVIKLGRARLKIDTICIGEIYESCQININISKNKEKKMIHNKKYSKTINTLKINTMTKSFNKLSSSNKEKEVIEESKVSVNCINDQEISDDGVTNKQKEIINNTSDISIQDSSRNLKPTCRICFLTNSDEENPLISPCQCSGSMKNIHYLCLKKCIEIKIIKKTEQYYKFYTWKTFSCEICKAEYPKYIRIKDSLFSLVDLEINFSSYVTCDYTLYDDTRKKTFRKGILIFKINDEADEDVITVGRSQNNKIKLKDISVSRSHCNFVKKKNKLYIVDKGSKFGTLIYLNNPLYINTNKSEGTLISGKHWFSINLIQNQSFFSKLFSAKCCGCSQVRQDGDIDVDGLLNKPTKCPIKIEPSKNKNDDNTEDGEESKMPIIDELYQDYVLDLGDNIYLHKNTEIQDVKLLDKINK